MTTHRGAIMRHPVSEKRTLIVTCLSCEWTEEVDDLDEAGRLMDEHMGLGEN